MFPLASGLLEQREACADGAGVEMLVVCTVDRREPGGGLMGRSLSETNITLYVRYREPNFCGTVAGPGRSPLRSLLCGLRKYFPLSVPWSHPPRGSWGGFPELMHIEASRMGPGTQPALPGPLACPQQGNVWVSTTYR